MSLTAISKDSNKEINSKDIVESSFDYECKHCKNKMIFVSRSFNGRIQHFRHESKCKFETEPESTEHLLGKQMLMEKLNLFNKQLEVKIDNHIVDIIGENDGKKYAIEYQCSPISIDDFVDRTNTYILNGFCPIWIFSTNFNNYRKEEDKGWYKLVRTNIIERYVSELDGCVIYLNTFTENIIRTCFLEFKKCKELRRVRDYEIPINRLISYVVYWKNR
jgi:competence CoiA-like predicted nuclease